MRQRVVRLVTLLTLSTLTTLALCRCFAAEKANEELNCNEIEGTAGLLKAGIVVLLGELHGTAEAPVFVRDLICLAMAKGQLVTVGLEIPRQEGELVTKYLGSAGTAEDRADILAGEFWQAEFTDGRSSEAMFGLLEEMRQFEKRGFPVTLVLLDDTNTNDRNAAMAEALMGAIAGSKPQFVVALTGNLHNRLTPGAPWDPDLEPMGYRVREALPETKVISLNMSYGGGSAWFCAGDTAAECKAYPVNGKGEGERRRIVLPDSPANSDYDGIFYIGAPTASPPAAATSTSAG